MKGKFSLLGHLGAISVILALGAGIAEGATGQITLPLCCKIPDNYPGTGNSVSVFSCFGSSGRNGELVAAKNVSVEKFLQWKPPQNYFVSPTPPNSVKLKFVRDCTFSNESYTLVAGASLNPASFISSGHLVVGSEYYHGNEYCIQRFNESSAEIKVCPSECVTPTGSQVSSQGPPKGSSTACIHKCCSPGSKFSVKNVNGTAKPACVPTSGDAFEPVLHSKKKLKRLLAIDRENIGLHYTKATRQSFQCNDNSMPQFYPSDPSGAEKLGLGSHSLCFRILADGTVKYRDPRRNWVAIPRKSFCVESIEELSTGMPRVYSDVDLGIIACSLPDPDPQDVARQKTSRIIYGTVMISSSIFLLLTFIVYALLFNQHGLHGWTTMGHSATMFLMYIFVGMAYLIPLDETTSDMRGSPGCVIIAMLAHYFFISTFCWLTLICFDLWYTFSSLSLKSSKGRKRFALYVAFGWMAPGIFVVSSFLLDMHHDPSTCTDLIVPGYGKINCYIYPEALGEFVFYPVAVLLGLNLIFFTVTTYKIHVYKKSTRIATNSVESNQQFFKLFAKLFFVMGITWIFEIVSWLHIGAEKQWYWMIFDIINVLQALLIFIIYVCKRETLNALQRNYHCFKVLLGPLLKLCRCTATRPDQSTSSLGSGNRKYPNRLGRQGANNSLITSSSVRASNTLSTTDTFV